MAIKKFNLKNDSKDLIWISPDGKRILSDNEANRYNAYRRSQLTIGDAWKDLKEISPEKAREIGWNNFQKSLRGLHGSRVKAIRRMVRKLKLEQIEEQLVDVADGTRMDERNGWGDSG